MKPFSSLNEEVKLIRGQAEKSAVLSFGRFNPPTTGHAKLVDAIASTAKKIKATPFLFPSRSQDSKKNPLPAKDKVGFLQKAFGRKVTVVDEESARTVFKAMESLVEKGYTNITLVVGSDRVSEFRKTITPYIEEMGINNFEVVSAGERDPDATDVSGMSASKMRAAAAADDFETFKQGVPKGLGSRDVMKMYDVLRSNMDITEDFISEEIAATAKKVIIFSEPNQEETDGYYPTVRKIMKECDKLNIKHIVIFTEPKSPYAPGYYTESRDDGTILVIDFDHKKRLIADPKDTLILVRGSIHGRTGIIDKIHEFETSGFCVINSLKSVETCADKYKTHTVLKKGGLPVARTEIITSPNPQTVKKIHNQIGGSFPLILKTLYGSEGKGVVMVKDESTLQSVIDAMYANNKKCQMLMQEYLKIDGDMRVIVLGGKVLASMRRKSGGSDFRSNFSLGGTVKNVATLEEDIETLAIRSAQACGCYICGVDITVTEDTKKPYIIEVNSSPGTDGIEKATGRNIAREMLENFLDTSNWNTIKKLQESDFKNKEATEDGIDFSSPPEEGTDEIVQRYKKMTPGELNELMDTYFIEKELT